MCVFSVTCPKPCSPPRPLRTPSGTPQFLNKNSLRAAAELRHNSRAPSELPQIPSQGPCELLQDSPRPPRLVRTPFSGFPQNSVRAPPEHLRAPSELLGLSLRRSSLRTPPKPLQGSIVSPSEPELPQSSSRAPPGSTKALSESIRGWDIA